MMRPQSEVLPMGQSIANAPISTTVVLAVKESTFNTAARLILQGKRVCGVHTSRRTLEEIASHIGLEETPHVQRGFFVDAMGLVLAFRGPEELAVLREATGNIGWYYPVLQNPKKIIGNKTFRQRFDGAYTFGTSYRTAADLDAVLRGVRYALVPNGLFAITGYNGREVRKIARRHTTKRYGSDNLPHQSQIPSVLSWIAQGQEMPYIFVDSVERTRDALERRKFHIIQDQQCYDGVGYFILAQRR